MKKVAVPSLLPIPAPALFGCLHRIQQPSEKEQPLSPNFLDYPPPQEQRCSCVTPVAKSPAFLSCGSCPALRDSGVLSTPERFRERRDRLLSCQSSEQPSPRPTCFPPGTQEQPCPRPALLHWPSKCQLGGYGASGRFSPSWRNQESVVAGGSPALRGCSISPSFELLTGFMMGVYDGDRGQRWWLN